MNDKQKVEYLVNELEKLLNTARKLLNSGKSKKKIDLKQVVREIKSRGDIAPVVPNYSQAKEFFGKSRVEKMVIKIDDFEIEEPSPPKPRKGRRTPQEVFEEKLKQERVNDFTCSDLVCFFRHCANEQGIRYAINWPKDMSQMKRLMKNEGGEFTNQEIVMMVEFLFYSKQNYLDKKRVSIGIFSTNWLNKIYQDAEDWVKDAYSTNQTNRKREWSGDKNEVTSIGGLN